MTASISKIRTLSCLALAVFVLRAATLPAAAQEGVTTKRNLPAVRFTTPPVIDGDLSDPCWKTAAHADRFTDNLYGNLVADQTDIYMGYDDKYIYVGFYAHDSHPQNIVAHQTKRGTRPNGDDYFAFSIDPYRSRKWEGRSWFLVNPLGTQFAHLAAGRGIKLEWEGAWKSAAKIVSDGWTGEVAVPWKILNYPNVHTPVTAGLNFNRWNQRTQINSWWSNIGVNETYELEGNWVGVEFPRFHPALSLLPYAAPDWDRDKGAELRSGLDARYTVTPGLTAVGTVNPDFQNVEGAVEGIDFSYGERYVPDRRPFFQEGQEIYGIGATYGNYFYSQRIPGFDVGENVYGKLTNRDSVGVLSALNLGHRYDSVLTDIHQLGTTSDVGAVLINRDGEGADNHVLVLGEDYRKKLWSANSSWSPSWVGGRQSGSAGDLSLNYQSPRWYAGVEPNFVSPHYQDDLGFIPFTDFKGYNTSAGYNQLWRKGVFRSFNAGASTHQTDHYDGSVFNHQRSIYTNVSTRSDYSVGLNWNGGRFEQFDDSVFGINLGARVSDPFHNYGIGYSFGRQGGARTTYLTPYVTWRFGEKLTLGITSATLHHQGTTQQQIFTFNYDFSPKSGIVGRVVSQTGGTGEYVAYRRSGYGGLETWLILGDPNAPKFQERVTAKVVWPL